MDASKDSKRRKDNYEEDDDKRRQKRSRRERSRSRSYENRRDRDSKRKRRYSRSRSADVPVKNEKNDNGPRKNTEKSKEVPDRPERKAKETDMLNTRTGGAYIPPARLRMMQAQITDKSSVAYQRLAWEALKKSIHGHINKINVGNIGIIIKELLKENIVRGRGLLCRSVIQAQAASPTFTNVYAALVAAVNSRFPNIGELLLKRLVIQFKRGFKRNDKAICISSASFIAHLVNQRVAHEILALELLTLLVETPTDDSVEVAIAFLKECGQKLTEVSSKGVNAIFEMLRNILHEGQLDKRVQYMIEVMFQVWKDGFKDHPALIEELELVPEEEQFTHLLMLDDATDPQDILNVFKFDDKYEENEQKYKTLSKEILGSDVESGEEDGSGESGSEGSEEEDEGEEKKEMTIIDNTETNLVALRRTIYLTINSSLDFEECAHKLMKMQLKPGQEVELCHMFLDCCAEQRTYEKFYGLLAQRFCNINRMYIGPFEEIFKDSYSTAHRLDTNRLRNVSKFFAHLLFTDSISWEVLECVKLNEEDTTSSSRIYIKILFQELAEYMGLKKLNDRLQDPTLQDAFSGIFPRDNPRNTRFSINFFTSIGLGGLTDELREHLKQMPKNVPPPITEITIDDESSSDSSSSSSSSSSDSSSSDSSSCEDEDENKKKKDKIKSKKKSKDKTQETPDENNDADKNKNVERWGHEGFYDTYGKDARRLESRPDREKERNDRNQFARPRDVRQTDRNWNNDQQNGDSRRFDRDRSDDRRRHNDNKRRDRSPEQSRRRYDDHIESEESKRNEDSRSRRRDKEDSRESSRPFKEDESRGPSKRNRQDDISESSRRPKDDSRESNRRTREENDRESNRRAKDEDGREPRRRVEEDDGRESSRHARDDNGESNKRSREDHGKDPRRRGEDDGRQPSRYAKEDDREISRRTREDDGGELNRRVRKDDDREANRRARDDDRETSRRGRDNDGESSRRARGDDQQSTSRVKDDVRDSSRRGKEENDRESNRGTKDVNIKDSSKRARDDEQARKQSEEINSDRKSNRRAKEVDKDSKRRARDDDDKESSRRTREDDDRELNSLAKEENDKKTSKRIKKHDLQKETSKSIKKNKDKRRDKENRRSNESSTESSEDDKSRKRKKDGKKESKKHRRQKEDSSSSDDSESEDDSDSSEDSESEDDSDSDENAQHAKRYWDRFDISKKGEISPEKSEKRRDKKRQRS